ncbi:MAG: hypothetical protein NTW20_11365 [Rhodobacterales bacterium]|nr:hypothetical protein [Rhodobacterales bacterium]
MALFLTAATASAQDGAKPCSCKNLESLQQDYQNALYLELAFNKLSTELDGYEKRDLAKGTSRSEIDNFGDQFYKDAVKVITKAMPFSVAGYTGPEVVPMPAGTCEQDPALLDALAKGSVCAGMADPALLHEFEHRELCKKMGPDAYWSRFGSELAAEEAERYKRQAANLKSEIKRVLDVSDVRLKGEWMHTLTGQGAELVFFYQFDSGKMSTAEEGDGFWKLKGKGTTSNELVSMKADGVSCVSSGAITNEMVVTMSTNGLSFGLELTETNTGGDMKIDCGYGAAMAVPTGEASSGQLAAGVPLKAGDTVVGNAWADQIIALAADGGMKVTGDPSTSLSITCEAP